MPGQALRDSNKSRKALRQLSCILGRKEKVWRTTLSSALIATSVPQFCENRITECGRHITHFTEML
jgi:hypothetical protein